MSISFSVACVCVCVCVWAPLPLYCIYSYVFYDRAWTSERRDISFSLTQSPPPPPLRHTAQWQSLYSPRRLCVLPDASVLSQTSLYFLGLIAPRRDFPRQAQLPSPPHLEQQLQTRPPRTALCALPALPHHHRQTCDCRLPCGRRALSSACCLSPPRLSRWAPKNTAPTPRTYC